MSTDPAKSIFRFLPSPHLPAVCLLFLMLGGLQGCALDYAEGRFLEGQKRWEEASIAYHLAVIDDPDDEEYLEAFNRTNKVVARENFELYRDFLAKKSFRKAYNRLVDAARQDPSYRAVQDELAKWDRVLIAGQIRFDFQVAQPSITAADKITLIVRINSPNPGETIDAEIDIDSGNFFVEDLLYNRPNELLTFYSINSIGVQLEYGRSRIKKFTSREYLRFVNIRIPVLDQMKGTLHLPGAGGIVPVSKHRETLPEENWPVEGRIPKPNPSYSMRIEGDRIVVSSPGGRGDFTPRFLYINKEDRRIFVDFGRYEVRQTRKKNRWELRRLSLPDGDYFQQFSRNIALAPYFFYRDIVFVFVPARSG